MDTVAQQVPHFIEVLRPLIGHYGYYAVFILVMVEGFGLPTPGVTILVAAAFFAGLGHLNASLVVTVGFTAAVIGDSIGFAIGNYAGERLVKRYGKYIFLTPERVEKAKLFFNKHGGGIIFIARFIDGLRQLNGIIAGLSGMRWLKFLLFQAAGAMLWAITWVIIGYLGGSHIATILEYQLYLAIAVGVIIIAFVAYHLLRRRGARQTKN